MRHFVVCRLAANNSGQRRDYMAVSGANPVRAAELYGQHLADCNSERFVSGRMMIEVMEVEVNDSEGVRTAMHSEGDLFYQCRLHGDATVTANFLENASKYAWDGESETGDWGRGNPMTSKQRLIGSSWVDEKGRTWKVVEMACVGRYTVVTTDRTRVGEMTPASIRHAIERWRLRVLSTPKGA